MTAAAAEPVGAIERSTGQPSRGATAPIEPRCLRKAEAVRYCRLTEHRFNGLVLAGLLPRPLAGTRHYDRYTLDEALERLAGFDLTSTTRKVFEAWRRSRRA